jgi:hypothetical protein
MINNVDLIENLFFSRKTSDLIEKEERNKTKELDFCCLNEIQISETIKQNLPNYPLFFDILTDYSNIKFSFRKPIFQHDNEYISDDIINEENEDINDDIINSNKKHILVNYSDQTRIDFYSFLLNLPTPKLMIFHIIDSYSYLIKSFSMLNANNICFFNISAEKIVFNITNLKPLLHDFEYSLYTRNLNEDYLCKIVDKIDDFSNMPLEIYVIFYLIKNNENSVSYSVIIEICDNFVKNMGVLSIFSQNYRDNFKIACIETLKKYINIPKKDIINDILTFSKTWDNYGLSILFLHIVGNMSRIFSLTNNFITKFSILLSKNINPIPSKREELHETIKKYNDLFNEYLDWSFINSISDEKMELLIEKLIK